MRLDIKQQCAGKWTGVLSSIGFPDHLLNGKHHICPFCTDKKWPRFRWDKNKEFAICNHCGSFQPIDLAIRWTGKPFKELTKIIRNERIDTMQPIKQTDDEATRAKNEARIKKIHAGLKHITPETAVGLYLIKRGISAYPELNCYAHEAVPYYEDGKLVAEYPAMVSVLRNEAGETVTHHITYLTADGKKLDCESPRKILPVIRPMKGAAIKLFNPMPMDVLAIAEGVETALSYYADSGIPTWAAVNTNGMETIEIPDHVKLVHIVCDEDSSFAGQAAAYALANRLKVKEGKKVSVIRISYSNTDLVQHFDNGIDKDFNDYLIAQKVA